MSSSSPPDAAGWPALLERVRELLAHDSARRPEVDALRESILNALFVIFASFAMIPVVIGAARAVAEDQPAFAVVYLLFGGVLVLSALAAGRLSFRTRAVAFLGIGIGLGVASLLRLGMSGIGLEVLTTFAVFASVLLGTRAGIATLVCALLALAVAGGVHVAGGVEVSIHNVASMSRPSAWVNAALVFSLITFMLLIAPQLLLRRLNEALNEKEARLAELTLAQHALQESESRLRDLLELLPEMVFETDLKGVVTYANRIAFTSFGYRLEDLHRYTVFELVADDDRERVGANVARVLGGERLGLVEYGLRRADGTLVPVMVNSAPILRDGVPVGLRGVLLDIAEKKRLEEGLQQAQKLEAVATLAAGVAHDFNNLLLGIQGRISLLRLGAGGGETEEHLAQMEASVTSAANLTRQLLALGRSGSFEARPLDPNELLRKTVTMFARTRKQLTIETRLEPAVGNVNADAGQLEQLLLNLLVNADQAMSSGGRIEVSSRSIELTHETAGRRNLRPGRYVCLEVQDSGPGIAPAIIPRIFDPFFTTKGRGKGSGLGLASAYGIARGHKGAIEVESEPGRGACFRVFVPATDQAAVREVPATTTVPGGRETILVIDDETLVLRVVRPMLSHLGYTVLTADTGERGVELLAHMRDAVDLVILDLVMPGASGVDTFQRLNEVVPRIPILLSSGYSGSDEAAQLLTSGARGFIAKPYRLSELAQKLREVLPQPAPVTTGVTSAS